jgi:hypothetical protein
MSAPLAHAVRGICRATDQAKLGDDEHDAALSALAHSRQDALAEPQSGAGVEAVAALKIMDGDVLDKVAPQQPGAAHEHLDWSECRLDFVDRR